MGNKRKTKTLPKLKQELGELHRKKVRLRDSNSNGYAECICCGKMVKYGTSDCQAGHYIPQGMGTRHKFTNENVNVCCYQCNIAKSGNYHEYRKGIIDKYGESTEDYLWTTRHEIFKPTRDWLENRIEEEKLEIILLQKVKGLK